MQGQSELTVAQGSMLTLMDSDFQMLFPTTVSAKATSSTPRHYLEGQGDLGSRLIVGIILTTLLETNIETQKGPYKDYSQFKIGLYYFVS